MNKAKTVLAVSAVAVYFLCPAYRYYVIGSWIGYKIMNNKPPKIKVVKWGGNVDVANTSTAN